MTGIFPGPGAIIKLIIFLFLVCYLSRDFIVPFIDCFLMDSGAPFKPEKIANIVSDYYQLLARMRYIPASSIKYPPHNPPINVSLAQSLGLEPQVIELLQLLPYVQGTQSEDEFILWGTFADYRQDGMLDQSRDPDYASPEGGFDDENGQYVQPWVIPLSECGNHGSIIYLNTKNSEITMLWQAGSGGGTSDPFFANMKTRPNVAPHPVNGNRIEHFPSRPAVDFFADFTNRLMSLEWVPFRNGMRILRSYGDLDSEDNQEWREVRTIYLTFGWPDDFDGLAFDKALHRYDEFTRVRRERYEVEDNFTQKKAELKYMLKHHEQHVQRKKSNGLWDNDPTKSPEEIQGLEDQIKDYEVAIEQRKSDYVKAKEEYEAYLKIDKDVAWEAAWKDRLEGLYRYHSNNYDWMTGEGKGRCTEKEIEATIRKMERLKQRLQDVTKEPKTFMDAITRSIDELDMSI